MSHKPGCDQFFFFGPLQMSCFICICFGFLYLFVLSEFAVYFILVHLCCQNGEVKRFSSFAYVLYICWCFPYLQYIELSVLIKKF